MAGPLARLVANIIVMGAGVVTKAFVQAYQQAIHNSRHGKTSTRTAAQTATTVSFRKIMPRDQALEILNFESTKKPTLEEIKQRYKKYFEANDPSRGGSFYLQSKIYRAKETLEKIIQEEQKIKGKI